MMQKADLRAYAAKLRFNYYSIQKASSSERTIKVSNSTQKPTWLSLTLLGHLKGLAYLSSLFIMSTRTACLPPSYSAPRKESTISRARA